MRFYQSWITPIPLTLLILNPISGGWFINHLLTVRREQKVTILEVAAL